MELRTGFLQSSNLKLWEAKTISSKKLGQSKMFHILRPDMNLEYSSSETAQAIASANRRTIQN